MIRDFGDSAREALLGRREHVALSVADQRAFAGRQVLITGAGGSVGAELARQIARCQPARLTLFDQSEYNLFRIERDLLDRWPALPLQPILGDVTRGRTIRHACHLAHPDIVYHAAACTHVTMAERAVCAAVETNVFGTVNVARAAREVGARLVVISSDNAAEPRSVMGATKRLSELVALDHSGAGFAPAIVRFGNILGSSGSVLEVMLECIRAGRPIPVTHPDASRYFMTASEAVCLVMKADLLGRGGEIYWLDLGPPVKILDLAHRLLALAKVSGLHSVPIRLIGLRPGEKLRAELTTQGIELGRTSHRRIWTAKQPPFDGAVIRRVLRALRDDILRGDAFSALSDLCAAVPDFRPSPAAWEMAGAAALGTVPTWAAPSEAARSA